MGPRYGPRMQTDIRERIAIVRQVFPTWSVAIPPTFEETFVHEGDYWHAWDDERSVSLTSVVVNDSQGPVAAKAIVDQLPPIDGTPVRALPAGLPGWAVEVDADPTARASRALSGMLAAEGRVLLATITGNDRVWVERTWLSIRYLVPGKHKPWPVGATTLVDWPTPD